MTLTTLALRLRRLLEYNWLIEQQQDMLSSYARLVLHQEEEIRHMKLEHAREIQGIVCGWLINLETPEVDVRDDLVQLEADLGHQIARLEEHIVR